LFLTSYSKGSPEVKSLINSVLMKIPIKNIIRATRNAKRFLTQKKSKN